MGARTRRRRLRDEKAPEEELAEALRSVVAGFALSLERPEQLLSQAIQRKRYGFSVDYWDTYPDKIMGASTEEVQRVARRYLAPETLQIVAVGDAAKIRPALQKFGAVEVYDTEGKRTASVGR